MGTGGLFLRRLRAKVDDRPTGFVWVDNHKVAGSGYPASRSQVAWLAKNGVNRILTLTEEPLPKHWTKGFGIEAAHVPMKDHEPPSADSMETAVNRIQAWKNEGKAVVVHCLAGEGRTGCVLAAYLIRTRKLGAEQAISTLRELKPGFVEWKQEKAVHEFASREWMASRPGGSS